MSNNIKKPVDMTGINLAKASSLSSNNSYVKGGIGKGFANTNLVEPIPKYISGECEKIINGANNTYIVLGRDRPSSRFSGYGGRGDTQAGSIDLIAGRMGYEAREVNDSGEDVYVDPDYTLDASRILISQKTDADQNFGLVEGRVGNPIGRSAIVLKSDAIRIIGREGIKLVTKTNSKNSRGGDINSVYGIDLIAGNDDQDLQPIPKGDNLQESLERIIEHHKDLCSIVENFVTYQLKINQAVATHTHIGNLAAPTSPSLELVASIIPNNIQIILKSLTKMMPHRANLEMFKLNYLASVGSKFINSRHNNTN